MTTETLEIIKLDSPHWMQRALCGDADPEDFYSHPEDKDMDPTRTARALRVCARCPVRSECLNWALEQDDHWAIMGGQTPRQRKATHRRMAWNRDKSPTRHTATR